MSDLNLTQFENEYLTQAFAPDILEANDRSLNEQLAATKIIASTDDPTPTVLGMLVLGSRTLDYLPGAYVQFLRFAGTELADDISDEEAISGTITDILRRLDEKLNGHNRTAVDFVSGPVVTADQHVSDRGPPANRPQCGHAPLVRGEQRSGESLLVRMTA